MGKVFVSYSSKDSDFVSRLAADLRAAGLEVYWDFTISKPGDTWETRITTTLSHCEYLLVVLTPDSIDSRWVQREYLKADEKKITTIPILYKDCETPLTLQNLQRIDARAGRYPACLPVILRALGVEAGQEAVVVPHAPALEVGGIHFVKIPAGKFIMGSRPDNALADDAEKPQHTIELPEYHIARCPVTNAQYARIVGKSFTLPEDRQDHPVVSVSWRDAQAFVTLLNKKFHAKLPENTGFSLPTEAQWEKAARGENANEWPWGNAFSETRCNSSEDGVTGTRPVGTYSPWGDSPYGAADMVGNVWEWTHTLLQKYPYKHDDGREEEDVPGNRVLRGGCFSSSRSSTRCAFRYSFSPDVQNSYIGFRVCIVPVP